MLNIQGCTYIGVFLTMACPLRCSYCINEYGTVRQSYRHLRGEEWVRILNNIPSRDDLPITLQGGEPTQHQDFFDIVNHVKRPMDLLTNLACDVEDFAQFVPKTAFKRNAPYPAIRVSFHPEQMEFNQTLWKVSYLQNAGFQIGMYLVQHPSIPVEQIEHWKILAEAHKVDFRLKEFLGEYKGTLYGCYKYPTGLTGVPQRAYCKSTELLVAPDGTVFWCHGDLYNNVREYRGMIQNVGFEFGVRSHVCNHFGLCNPCDVKLKTDRFQQFGYCATEIDF